MNTRGRYTTLLRFQARLELPMIVLAFVWLALFIVEAVWGGRRWMEIAGSAIWAAFVVEFVVGYVLAPRKWSYVRRNWLKAVALLAPALRMLRMVRVLRLARAARLARGARVVRIVSSLNRGMRALGHTLGRRGAPYVVVLTLLVTVAGAAGMYAFENDPAGERGFDGFADALWWTGMIMTTMGSAYWPETAAGRVLCILLSLYAFAVFGYVTALLASFFVGRDVETGQLRANEVARLADEISQLRTSLEAKAGAGAAAAGADAN
ncbi:potassium channel family protein [Luteimonas sp. 50]|uniref:Potassium channel family protein n=1 Tax=Cognatiluteimonas sedimenti TaxID=2927791 RepID=A0ABT0A721_9GAMM|nr:potassium channel family protein [Lysobacter sedimenti]MCJ0826783.1 potassium channel family protein [Lysobacter sedimenti]